jgi:hypothetical protein
MNDACRISGQIPVMLFFISCIRLDAGFACRLSVLVLKLDGYYFEKTKKI